MKDRLCIANRNPLLAAACCALALLTANDASAEVVLDFVVDANEFDSSEIPGFGLIRLYTIGMPNGDGTRTPIILEASTDYTINVSFADNQALRVFASQESAGFEDVAFLSTIFKSTSPGSATGTATLLGVSGDYSGSNPYDLSTFIFPEQFVDFFVLGADQDLTATSFRFTGVTFQFTTSSDMTDFTPVFSAVQVGGGGFEVVPAVELVTIDIKPGSDTNCFNANGRGVIPVAVLGTESFDVSSIDQSTLSFGGAAIRVRGNKGPFCGLEDVNADGYSDIVCHFEDNPQYWEPGQDNATLTGALLDGTSIEGEDSICVVP